jgi:ribA/ribD-fused uncharacterized protein
VDVEVKDLLDVTSLITAVRDGLQPKYIFFWGHHPSADGRIRKSCFSQWWPGSFVVDGVVYKTAEHYMMAEKARLFEDEAAREKIIAAGHPGEAKKLGRGVQGFNIQRWEQHRFDIVVRGNLAKFRQNEELKTFLLNSRSRVLVEASPVDKIWGIGLAAEDVRAQNPEEWQGLNLLGFGLMVVRERLGAEK